VTPRKLAASQTAIGLPQRAYATQRHPSCAVGVIKDLSVAVLDLQRPCNKSNASCGSSGDDRGARIRSGEDIGEFPSIEKIVLRQVQSFLIDGVALIARELRAGFVGKGVAGRRADEEDQD
jgi:hypothetical protein